MKLRWIALVVLFAHRASALSCADPSFDVGVRAGATLPANAKPKMLRRRTDDQKGEYTMVCAKEAGASGPVAIDVRDLGGSIVYAIELAPRQLLPEGAACAILHDGWFSTWFLVSSATHDKGPRVRGTKRTTIATSGWDVYPHTFLPLVGTIEEGSVAQIWTAPVGESIDYTKTPSTWAYVQTDWESRIPGLKLHAKGDCSTRNFDFPAYGDTVHAGIRVIDAAGNASEPIEVLVNGPPNGYQAGKLGDVVTEIVPIGAPIEKRKGPLPIRLLVLGILVAAVLGALWLERQPSHQTS